MTMESPLPYPVDGIKLYDVDNDVEDNSSTESDIDNYFEASEHHDETKEVAKAEVKQLAKEDTLWMNLSKVILCLTILATGIAFCATTFKLLKKEEESNFATNYHEIAKSICDAAEFHAQNLFLAMESAAKTVSGAAIATKAEFPFVTVPTFEILGQVTRAKSGVEFLLFTPIVNDTILNEWGNYTEKNQWWVNESRSLALASGEGHWVSEDYSLKKIKPRIFEYDLDDPTIEIEPTTSSPYFPIWQMSPPPFDPSHIINFNRASKPFFASHLGSVLGSREGTMSPVFNPKVLANWAIKEEDHDAYHAQFVAPPIKTTTGDDNEEDVFGRPHCGFMQPVYKDMYDATSEIVATMQAVVPFDRYMVNLLPSMISGIDIVIQNTCDQAFTYTLEGNKARYVGLGDHHDRRYDEFLVKAPFSRFNDASTKEVEGHCVYFFNIYPTEAYVNENRPLKTPVHMTLAVAFAFLFLIGSFVAYDWFVRRRNDKVVGAAISSNAILSSLFPTSVKQRLVEERDDQEKQKRSKGPKKTFLSSTATRRTKNNKFINDNDNSESMFNDKSSKPIADLFPSTTIIFADLVGFTAWSSTREPSQVFVLLETLYNAFDKIADRRQIYKVETIGDCYVAVSGLPTPCNDHAVKMVRFARDCLAKMHSLSNKLEVMLGPDTSELGIRIGLHSGPVTGGVLRGQRSRFQLFGDTVNTASRMETTGLPNKIHVSQETADQLIHFGKSCWLTQREDKVVAKGKGELTTYWVSLRSSSSNPSSTSGGRSTEKTSLTGSEEFLNHNQSLADFDLGDSFTNDKDNLDTSAGLDPKTRRLVKWTVENMAVFLKQIQAHRDKKSRRYKLKKIKSLRGSKLSSIDGSIDTNRKKGAQNIPRTNSTVFDEVQESICLSEYDAEVLSKSQHRQRRRKSGASEVDDVEATELSPEVLDQLESYISRIATLYNDENPFHNFSHASHVALSAIKLMSRIVSPNNTSVEESLKREVSSRRLLHDHTFGITSDPLIQFACVFSAIIHDVGHVGVPNGQLIKENQELASKYKNKSVAEQNSVDLSWNMLEEDCYKDLRKAIYETDEERTRFRHLVVNSVLATDIFDPDLVKLRNSRWEKAFKTKNTDMNHNAKEDTDRKATIVIEHLIQASDVAHTMQHWHVYVKWNQKLFEEMCKAHQDGRTTNEKDPSEGWYKGELWFYDNYIIPLAKKLKDCGVFGVSSDEYLNYALKNRAEWESKGRQVVDGFVSEIQKSSSKSLAKSSLKKK